MFPVVKEMLNEMCELAKNDTKEKADHDLGSWKCAVTYADGVWHKREMAEQKCDNLRLLLVLPGTSVCQHPILCLWCRCGV